MKKLLVFLMALVATLTATAQDVIVKNDNSTILCKIVEVNNNEVVYLKWSELNGPRYVMDRSLIANINYQDGRQDKLNQQTSNAYAPGNQQTGTSYYNDNMLVTMDKNRSIYEQKAKKIRIIGWTVGGALTVTGIALIIAGLSSESESYISSMGYSKVDYCNPILCGVGGGLSALGIGTLTYCLIKANQVQKKAQALSFAPVFQQEFNLGNGKSLCAGVDVIRDRQYKQTTLGLGLQYNF